MKIPRLSRKQKTLLGSGTTSFFLLAVLLLIYIATPPASPAQAYSVFVDNNVDADSDEDVVANIGTNDSSFSNAQSLDGTDQVIQEVNQGSDTEDPMDAVTDSQSPTDLGAYSAWTNMQAKDGSQNILTEAQGSGYVAQEGGVLPSVKDSISYDTTTSATFEDVDGLSVNIITSATSDILLLASIQALGSTASVGGWRLVFDGTNFHDLQRQLDATYDGNILLTDLVDDKAAGNYELKLQHKIDTGTLNTSNVVIVAVSLHNGEGIVPANDSYVASDTVGNGWFDVTGLSTELTLSRTSHIVAISSWNGYFDSANKDSGFALNINAVRLEENKRDFGTANQYGCVSAVTRTTTALSAGTYTIKAEWDGMGGTTLTGENFSLVTFAAEANSGDQIIDIQKSVVATDSTTATTIEDIDGSTLTGTINNTAHILAIMTLDSDVSSAGTNICSTININGTDYDVMDRGHPSAAQHGSIGQVVRTDSTIAEGGMNATGRWYTDSGNTLTGTNIVLVSVVLFAGSSEALAVDDYEFDREFSFSSLTTDMFYEELVIFTGTVGTEPLDIFVWDTGAWVNIAEIEDADDSVWINITISSYLDSSSEYFSFRDTDQANEGTQNTWQIDYVGIHIWSPNYRLEWEHQVISADTQKDSYDLTVYGWSDEGPSNANYFSNYKTVTIDSTKVSGSSDLVNFTVLVNLTDTDLKTDVETDGDDIRFGNASIWYDHELELFDQGFNATHAHLVAWVRIPTLSATSDAYFRMYYGNTTMTAQESPEDVWDSNYRGVWHLGDDPSPYYYDSTANDNDGIADNSPINDTTSKINGGVSFDDTNERSVNVSDSTSLQLATNIMLSVWINTTNTETDVGLVVNKWGNAGSDRNYWLGKLDENFFVFFIDDTYDLQYALSNFNDGEWHYVVATANDTTMSMYLDGVLVNSTSWDGTSVMGTSELHIGKASETISQSWDGDIDEVRVSSNSRSPDWIATEFNNQDETSVFYSVGAEALLSEPFKIQLWNTTDSNWLNTSYYIEYTEKWYNFSIGSYSGVINTDITWRYIDNDTTSDVVQSSLRIDYAGVSAWNFTMDIVEATFTITKYNQGEGNVTFPECPLTINVSSGVSYNIQIKAVDGDGNPVTNDYLWFDTDASPVGATQLSTTYQDLYLSRAAGDGNTHSVWIWVDVPFGVGDQTMTFTLWVQIVEA